MATFFQSGDEQYSRTPLVPFLVSCKKRYDLGNVTIDTALIKLIDAAIRSAGTIAFLLHIFLLGHNSISKNSLRVVQVHHCSTAYVRFRMFGLSHS